jgi:hypothetical protein
MLWTAALLPLVACARQEPSPDVSSIRTASTCPPADTSPIRVPVRAQRGRNADSVRVVLDSLDRQIASAAEADLPVLLFALGHAKTAFQPSDRSPQASYARARPGEFTHSEPGDVWLYNGADFQELIRRFPTSTLVDGAAYAMTLLERPGECEGDVGCYIGSEWLPLSAFLRTHPNSPRADSAVARVLGAFRRLDLVADLRAATTESEPENYDPEAVRKLVASLDTVGRLLPAPWRTRLLERAGQLWDQFADYDRAKVAYRAALANASAEARACIEARLTKLPVRSFALEPTRVIHPRRVELRWQPSFAGTSAFVIYRSNARAERGVAMGRVPATALTWTDTTTGPGATYWYRVRAEAPGEAAQSNPASARTPTQRLTPHGIAVSTTDRRLYVFGTLSNGFPQVIRISMDGASVERSDGMIIEQVGAAGAHAFDAYSDEVWLADANGHGVLHFPKPGADVPADVFSVLRKGSRTLREYLFALHQGGEPLRAYLTRSSGAMLVSVDEPAGAAWIEQGGGGARTAISMDCVSAASICWVGYERDVVLRNAAGGTITSVRLSQDDHGCDAGCVTAIHADPHDSSAWMVLGRAGRLLHMDRAGAIRHDLKLTDARLWYLGEIGSQILTADLDRRTIWFLRPGPGRGMELAQIDLNAADPQPRVVSSGVLALARLAPDLDGGVWLVTRDDVRRMDGNGRTLFTIALSGR